MNACRDPAFSASLAGLLLAHHGITPEQHVAACRFAGLRASIFGLILPLPR